jgi:hypothetical protein
MDKILRRVVPTFIKAAGHVHVWLLRFLSVKRRRRKGPSSYYMDIPLAPHVVGRLVNRSGMVQFRTAQEQTKMSIVFSRP